MGHLAGNTLPLLVNTYYTFLSLVNTVHNVFLLVRLEDLLMGKTVGATLGGNKFVTGLKTLEMLILDEADR